jgi:hypothetical protein
VFSEVKGHDTKIRSRERRLTSLQWPAASGRVSNKFFIEPDATSTWFLIEAATIFKMLPLARDPRSQLRIAIVRQSECINTVLNVESFRVTRRAVCFSPEYPNHVNFVQAEKVLS